MTQRAKIKRESTILKVDEIAKLYESANTAQEAADVACQSLAKSMLKWIREKLPAGTVIDLRIDRGSPRPEYLRDVKVMSGNSRGTHIFRIERIRYVEPNVFHSDLSAWYADATPISMTTGKDMKGTAGNAIQAREFLGLKGSFGFESYPDED